MLYMCVCDQFTGVKHFFNHWILIHKQSQTSHWHTFMSNLSTISHWFYVYWQTTAFIFLTINKDINSAFYLWVTVTFHTPSSGTLVIHVVHWQLTYPLPGYVSRTLTVPCCNEFLSCPDPRWGAGHKLCQVILQSWTKYGTTTLYM